MLRVLHMADVHLGVRHPGMGTAAAAQRERQYVAFVAALRLAASEHVDLVLIAGDLFDSNVQPRRTVERVAGDLRRAVDAGCRVILLPGLHDIYDSASVYRAWDLVTLAGLAPDADSLVVLTPDRASVTIPALDVVVHGRVPASMQAAGGVPATFDDSVRWRIGLAHGSLRTPDGWIGDGDGPFTEADIAASGLDYLALGHAHSFRQGRAGVTTWAYPGAPEPVDVERDGIGQVLLVGLRDVEGADRVRVATRTTGRTRHLRLDLEAAAVPGQEALAAHLETLANPDIVCDVRLTGPRPDGLRIDEVDLARRLGGAFLHFRFRDLTVPPLPSGPLPPPDTIAGAFLRDVIARINAAEAEGRHADALELREVLRLGQRVIAGRSIADA
jgi:DNA repair protein SbcD/Mre11